MLRIYTKGPNWKKVRGLMRNYDKRIAFARLRAAQLMAENLLSFIHDYAPDDQEFKSYLSSLRVVRLGGSKGFASFALVTDTMRETIGDVRRDGRSQKTVAYIGISEGAQEGAILLSENNPWPVQMLPARLPNGISMVHKIVSSGEMEWAMEKTKKFLDRNRGALDAAGVNVGDNGQETELVESTPDNVTLALRTEFGINTEARPHWRPALHKLRSSMVSIIKKDRKIRDALGNWLFQDHLMRFPGEELDMREFQDRAGLFQRKVLMRP